MENHTDTSKNQKNEVQGWQPLELILSEPGSCLLKPQRRFGQPCYHAEESRIPYFNMANGKFLWKHEFFSNALSWLPCPPYPPATLCFTTVRSVACLCPQQSSVSSLKAFIIMITFSLHLLFQFNNQSICAQPQLIPPLASLKHQISRPCVILVMLSGLT